MARWGKNIVVPLDSLIKEKENTNRPTAARSAGTVGKWGKMGFTSTRTYALQSISAEVSPGQSPDAATGSTGEGDSSPTREAPKPKKFFKSRNSAATLITTQFIQHLPRAPPSPIRDAYPASASTPHHHGSHGRDPIKLKIPKSVERKASFTSERPVKPKKKKEEKKLKPEAPPSRVTSRSRKIVNYNEEEDWERSPTPLKDVIVPKVPTMPPVAPAFVPETSTNTVSLSVAAPPPLPPPPKTPNPEHPPIVLRISKGTSRLVSTDSEEQINSPQHDFQSNCNNTNSILAFNSSSAEPHKTPLENSVNFEKPPPETNIIPQSATVSPPIPKLIVKPLPPPTAPPPTLPPPPPVAAPAPVPPPDEPEEFNYYTVKISPDKPPKERLKLIIKTDVIRNKLAAAAASAAASSSASSGDKPEKEKKSKSKKHKHLKSIMAAKEDEFKTPSPQQSTENYRTIISPPAPSERDFDSQSSVLGSISSKGNSTPLAQAIPEEACVIRSRGSSDITSDLETSQHSSLVAPPSDIESRLESMMDGEDVVDVPKDVLVNEEPLQEDILEVLTGGAEVAEGEEEKMVTEEEKMVIDEEIMVTEEEAVVSEELPEEPATRRVTRGSRVPREPPAKEPVSKETPVKEPVEEAVPKEVPTTRRTRRGAQIAQSAQPSPTPEAAVETPPSPVVISPTRRTTRRQVAAVSADPDPAEDEPMPEPALVEVAPKRGGRVTRNNNINNNNIKSPASKSEPAQANTTPPVPIRSYGRKRKNALTAPEGSVSPAKLSAQAEDVNAPDPEAHLKSTCSMDISYESEQLQANSVPTTEAEPVSLVMPKLTAAPEEVQRRDYKIKDKFKRTWLERDAREKQEAAQKAAAAEQLAKSEAGKLKVDDDDMLEKQPMKLVISKKKGSIFKSRVADQYPKRHVYKHRWDEHQNGEQTAEAPNTSESPVPPKAAADAIFDDFSEDCDNSQEAPQPKLTRVVKQTYGANKFEEEPVTSVRCDRKAKEYYTVVRNVKTAHQIQEFGEFQQIEDDVDYFLEALQPQNQMSMRCLSALKLASKCMTPAFRMHVRAHGVVTKFFKALSDANADLSLGLCTSAIMFILSQDALNMDLDRDSLELMMNLLEADVANPANPAEIASYNRNKETVKGICEQIKSQGKATHLNMDSLSSGTLAMETLLSLTSKRAGEWFKEELRNLGGLEHIIKVICECCRQTTEAEKDNCIDWTPSLLDNMKTIERCMRVLENVTQVNQKNQDYILDYRNGEAINTLFKLYQMCDREIALFPTTDYTSKDNPGVVLRETLIPTLKVLINITHPFDSNANGSSVIGQRKDIFDTSFHILLQAPNYIPERCVFELSMLVLLLLINLTMHTVANRTTIMKALAPADFNSIADRMPAIKALIEYFYKCEELARLVEKNTDAILDNTEQKKKQEEVDETVNNLLQKAGHHMEHTLKGSYAGILIGHLITDSEENENVVRTYLRENGFKEIIGVLEKYYTFMNLTASSEATIVSHIKSTKKLIDYFKKRDIMNDGSSPAPSMNFNDSASTSPTPSPAISTRSTQRVYKTYSQR